MAKTRMTRGKFTGITTLADARGVISATAMDQRGSLRKMIGAARGGGAVGDEDLACFKEVVTEVLTHHASAVLLDPEYGLDALAHKDPRAGALLAYEKTGYDATVAGRLPDLLDGWSVRRLVAAGADAIKVLLYYNPADAERTNAIKQAFVERVGAECAGNDVPFLLEIVTYDDRLGDPAGLAFARAKPAHVTRSIAEFTQPRYGIDVLKVEVPVNLSFVAGTRALAGTAAYSYQDALRYFREAASAATRPFIYLSAGVTDAVFREALELAGEAGVGFAGVLCGRATWQEGVPAYARGGVDGLRAWLEGRGVENITALNTLLAKVTVPWWTAYGGKDQIEVIGPKKG